MSEFRVVADHLNEAALRIQGIAPRVEDLHRRADAHGAAAHGTGAHQGLSDLMDHWGAVLPHFCAASSGLSDHLSRAAAAYHATDLNIARGAIPTHSGSAQ